MEVNIKEKVLAWQGSGRGFIDLRSNEAFEKYHVVDSTNMPARQLPELGRYTFSYNRYYCER
jgi:rhodanese-related sulfurtransferase